MNPENKKLYCVMYNHDNVVKDCTYIAYLTKNEADFINLLGDGKVFCFEIEQDKIVTFRELSIDIVEKAKQLKTSTLDAYEGGIDYVF